MAAGGGGGRVSGPTGEAGDVWLVVGPTGVATSRPTAAGIGDDPIGVCAVGTGGDLLDEGPAIVVASIGPVVGHAGECASRLISAGGGDNHSRASPVEAGGK